jgi:predicted porin
MATAASYSFGTAKLMAGYRWGQNKAPSGNTLQRDDLYWIGGTYQVTPALSLAVSYNYQNLKSFLGSTSTPNPWQIGFLSSYSFSKRTDLYLTSAFSKHAGLILDSPATVFANSLALGNSYVLAAGKDNMFGVAVGIRHTF